MPMNDAGIPAFLQPLLQDLFDALWLEDLYGFRGRCRLLDGTCDILLDDGAPDPRTQRRVRLFGARAQGLRPFRIERCVPLCIDANGERRLEVAQIAALLEQASWWRAPAGRLSDAFALACTQAGFAAMHVPAILARLRAEPDELRHWEALASLRDRPFHPLARGKAWGEMPQAWARFGAEADQAICLRWVAVARRSWVATACAPPSRYLLTPTQQARLQRHARSRGLDPLDYEWLPMHPWQHDYWGRTHGWRAAAIDLDIRLGHGHATASLRTLALQGRRGVHLKLPVSLPLLGATRSLPSRYLHNGVQAQRCLARLRRRDPWLASQLALCDEDHWWAMRQHAHVTQDPGELACQLRRYPQVGNGAVLVPMAALPVVLEDGSLPAFKLLLGAGYAPEALWKAFERIAALTLELGLRCFGAGTMPELHGQNLLLAWRDGVPVVAVLRDHDSLRICAPMMRSSGLPVPDYLLAPDSPNNLLLESPAQLLAYLQTLLVEVNLYAVLAAIATHLGEAEAQGWQRLQCALEGVLSRIGLPGPVAAEVRAQLLCAPRWPFKQILQPALECSEPVTGMPAAMGTWPNPLLPDAVAAY